MPLEDARSDRLDGDTVGDVARLGLAAELLSERLEPVGAAGEQDAEVAPRGQQAGDLDADARRGPRDNRDLAHVEQAIAVGGPGETAAMPARRARRRDSSLRSSADFVGSGVLGDHADRNHYQRSLRPWLAPPIARSGEHRTAETS